MVKKHSEDRPFPIERAPGTKSPSFETNVKVHFHLQDGKHCKDKVFPDISDEEMFAIGRVTVSWAYLEHAILDDCLQMADAHRVPLSPDAFVVPLKPRLRVWRDLIKKYRKGKRRDRLLKIISSIENAQRSRNQITHGLWNWEYSSADRVTAKSYKPRFEFTQPFDFTKLLKLSDTLGEINFELMYPKGRIQAMKALAARPNRVSREFALMMTGKQKTPHLPERSAALPEVLAEALAKIYTPAKPDE
jgi:hypothetical protein